MTEFDLTRRETYRHWTPVTIRYSDRFARHEGMSRGSMTTPHGLQLMVETLTFC